MKKITLTLIAAVTLTYSNFIFSETIKTINQEPNWNGFYLGGNAGYWRAQTNEVATTGSAGFINQTFEPGASNITNALVQMAANNFSLHPDGFIGGVK